METLYRSGYRFIAAVCEDARAHSAAQAQPARGKLVGRERALDLLPDEAIAANLLSRCIVFPLRSTPAAKGISLEDNPLNCRNGFRVTLKSSTHLAHRIGDLASVEIRLVVGRSGYIISGAVDSRGVCPVG